MNHMRATGIAKVTPRLDPGDGVKESNFRGGHFNGGLTSNYFTRQVNTTKWSSVFRHSVNRKNF